MGENHILSFSFPVTGVKNEARKVTYAVAAEGEELLKLAFAPSSETLNGKKIERGTLGWTFGRQTQLLKLVHKGNGMAIVN